VHYRRGRPAEQRADAVVVAAPKVGSARPSTRTNYRQHTDSGACQV